ncbi:MAG: acyltransferase family protein [Clostridia bacterium]|nr:acyltransferase family protein [Clostridia bacterium]
MKADETTDHSANEFTPPPPYTKQEKSSDANHNTIKPIPELKGTPSNERIEWIVILRAFACMAIIVIHIIDCYVAYIQYIDFHKYGVVRSVINEIILQPLIRFAVPCFIMISGTLLLDPKRNTTINKIIKYIIKIIILFVVLWLGYCFAHDLTFNSLRNFENLKKWIYQSFLKFFNGLMQGNLYTFAPWLWYLPMLISLYILTPILRKFTEFADRKTARCVLIILFVTTCIIPTINNYFNFEIVPVTELSSVVFMYLVGYYITNTDFINSKLIYIGGVVGVIFYLIGCYFGVSHPLDVFMVLESMMILKVFLSHKIKIKNNSFFNCIAKYSLGIYATNIFWLHVLKVAKIHFTLLPIFIGEFMVFAFTLVMSLLTSMILYRLPLIKKLFTK